MVESIQIRSFKSVADATLRFAPLTLLIGTNASGKSNLLEAVQLLAWVATGQRLGELPHAIRQSALAIRGTVGNLRPIGSDGRPIQFDVHLDRSADRGRLLLHLGLAVDTGEIRIVEESLHAPDLQNTALPLYHTTASAESHGHDLVVEYNNFLRGGKKPTVACVSDRPVFTQLVTGARFDKRHSQSQTLIPPAAESVRAALQGMVFLDPDPRSMRGYAFREERLLQGNGANLSAVLWNLAQDPNSRTRLLETIVRIPDHEVEDIGFIETQRNEVMVKLRERFGSSSRDVEAALLSDGTLRVLAIAAALLSVPEGSIVVIEEIDNGVHPSRAKHLLDQIASIATTRRLRVLITTHNPALQDDLPRNALEDVLVAYRDATSGGTRVSRLGELPSFPALVLRGPLGQLVTRRTLDRYLPNHAQEAAAPELDLGFLDSEE